MADTYEIGLLAKDVGNFDAGSYDGRITFQRTIHIMQSFGIDLGYYYHWMLKGPYSLELAKDCHCVAEAVKNIPDIPVEFRHEEDQAAYNDFKRFIDPIKDDPDQLDIATSICHLHNEIGVGKDPAIDLTAGKSERYGIVECRQVWDDLERYGVVGIKSGGAEPMPV